MIHESYPWKKELAQHAKVIRTIVSKNPDKIPFRIERALFYSSFIVRKLIENRKITDKCSNQCLKVILFETEPEPVESAFRDMPGHFHLKEEADGETLRMPIDDISCEIIHSYGLIWTNDDSEKLHHAIVSSYRNQGKRAIALSLLDWASSLDNIAEDCVIRITSEKGEAGKRGKRTYS